MFADVCLACSKPVYGTRAYCCDECALSDISTPSLSSASSAHHSPHIPPLHSAPALHDVSSLLVNPAIRTSAKHSRKRSSISSSSTSSYLSTPSAPALTDDEDSISDLDRDFLDLRFNPLHPTQAHSARRTSFTESRNDLGADHDAFDIIRPSGLSYARRPSTTNTRSTIPVPLLKHQNGGPDSRSPESSLPAFCPQYAVDDDRDMDDLSLLSASLSSTPSRRRRHGESNVDDKTLSHRPKRSRGSLPSFFSLLQIGLDSTRHPQAGAASTSPSSTLRHSLELARAGASPDTPTTGAAARLRRAMATTSQTRSRSRSRSASQDRRRRLRINSVEKVQDWVHTATATIISPRTASMAINVNVNVNGTFSRGRQSARKRLSSTERLVSTEPLIAPGIDGLGTFAGDCERGRAREVERGWERERGRTESRGRPSRRWQEPERQQEGLDSDERGRRRSVAMRARN